jgi:hypothetical protein
MIMICIPLSKVAASAVLLDQPAPLNSPLVRHPPEANQQASCMELHLGDDPSATWPISPSPQDRPSSRPHY